VAHQLLENPRFARRKVGPAALRSDYNAAPWARSTSTGGAAGQQQVAQTLSDKRETRALAAAAGHKFGGRARAPRAGSQGPRRGQRRRGGDRERNPAR